MKAQIKEVRGFGVLPLIIVIAVLAMIGGGGYLWWHKNVDNNKPATTAMTPTPKESGAASTPTVSPSISATPVDDNAGWKTYTAKHEGLSFRYPADWMLAALDPANPQGDGVSLTAPSGKIAVKYDSQVSGLGGACGDPCPKAVVYHSEKFQIPGGNEVSFVEMADYHRFGLVDVQHYPDTALYYLLFASKHAGDDPQWFYGYPVGAHTYGSLPADQYFTLPEVKTAEKIIKSARYE